MTIVTKTASQIVPTKALPLEIVTRIAAATLTPGDVCALNVSGKSILAAAAGSAIVDGIALGTAYPGQAVSLIRRGFLAGFTLTNQAYGAILYLAAASGSINDASPAGAGTSVVPLGRVDAVPDGASPTKLVFVDISSSTAYGTA